VKDRAASASRCATTARPRASSAALQSASAPPASRPSEAARTVSPYTAARVGYLRTHLAAFSSRPGGRTLTGSPARKRFRSSASAAAVGYRACGHFSRHFRQISSRSAGTPGANLRGASLRSADLSHADLAGAALPASVLVSQFVFCDGSQPVYQASPTAPASLVDLAAVPGSTPSPLSANTSYQVTQSAGIWTPSPASTAFSSSSVLNAASFQPGISPGGIFSLFGAGLAGSGAATTVTAAGQPVKVLLATPFQINAQLPATIPAGSATIQVTSPFGSASQSVPVQATAPGIFVIGTATDGQSALGAIVNQNGTINGPTSPAPRGSTVVIYCTGLGTTSVKNGLSITTTPVSVTLNNSNVPAALQASPPDSSASTR